MDLKDAIREYRKAKRNVRVVTRKVAKSKNLITSKDVSMTVCFHKAVNGSNSSLRSLGNFCFGNTLELKPGPFCNGCSCYSRRLEYEKNCLELKKQLEKRQCLKQELIDAIKKAFVKSR